MVVRFKALLIVAFFLAAFVTCTAQQNKSKSWKYMSYTNLVMVGYQGWFNAEGDGADRGWNHYTHDKVF